MSEVIQRVAARGDGITESGAYYPLTAPGDKVEAGKILERGSHFQQPPCRHFPPCGGCQLQHLDDAAYAGFCEDRIRFALAGKELQTEIRPAKLSPPRSRRRASLKAAKAGNRVLIGFNEGRSHRIVDMHECYVLRPELFALVEPLRGLLGGPLNLTRGGEVTMSLTDQGVDLGLAGVAAEGLEAAEAIPTFAEKHGVARLTLDEGLGPEVRYEPYPVTATLGGTVVSFPPGAFLQATAEGEAALVEAAREAAAPGPLLDLFAGLGTFTLQLAPDDHAILAVEADRRATLSLMAAAKLVPHFIQVEHRDLYRNPLGGDELASYATVLLDPPRAGAEAQARALASAGNPRIVYVSCNPDTFARDAKILADGDYRLDWVQPVGQFTWSTHVELAACFSRQA